MAYDIFYYAKCALEETERLRISDCFNVPLYEQNVIARIIEWESKQHGL